MSTNNHRDFELQWRRDIVLKTDRLTTGWTGMHANRHACTHISWQTRLNTTLKFPLLAHTSDSLFDSAVALLTRQWSARLGTMLCNSSNPVCGETKKKKTEVREMQFSPQANTLSSAKHIIAVSKLCAKMTEKKGSCFPCCDQALLQNVPSQHWMV